MFSNIICLNLYHDLFMNKKQINENNIKFALIFFKKTKTEKIKI